MSDKNSNFRYKFPQPQYLGAKFRHLDWIGQYIPDNLNCVCDAFSGSQSVAYYFKQMGYKVITNDFLNSCNQIGKALIENKDQILTEKDINVLFSNNSNPNYYNLIQTLYTNLFFLEPDCIFLDSYRSNVEKLSPYKKNLALTIMNRALTRKVTMGHFASTMTLKYAEDPIRVKRNRNLIRPIKDIFLDLLPKYNEAIFDNHKNNESYNLDAIQLIEENTDKIDLLYLDPPYCGSHPNYQSFYHLLETYTEYWKDKKFINSTKSYYPTKISGFDKKTDIEMSFQKLFTVSKKIPYWIISYNDRSFPKKDEMLQMISEFKDVKVVNKIYNNNVGGKGSVKGSSELLFICSPKE